MHTVAVAVVNGTAQFELAVACEVFGIDRSAMFDDWYDFRLCAAEPGPVRTAGGLVLDTPYGVDDLVDADTVIVPAAGERAGEHAPLIAAVQKAYANGARIASICTGAFILAEAGLLDGKRATTHWAHAAEFAAQYPAVDVDPDVLYVQDGQIFTSAGTAAGIDLCLHMVRLDLGTDVANALARRMVVPPHRDGGQAQYVEAPLPRCDSETLGPLLDWALARLDEPLTLPDLAKQANVSVRTLVRRFAAATGTTPLQWLLSQRVRRAQHLLESSDEPVERIASLAGFGSAANLRQHFTRSVGVPPMHYRRTFRGELRQPA
ncbi:MAG: AraC family transcriptional regulator, transcriptional activator FtrA, partial [Frankiaceae bacterium]|nr:AraC family transcriptional regulator, transcriptional activator FtrA [Frankiaceae bacterium]